VHKRHQEKPRVQRDRIHHYPNPRQRQAPQQPSHAQGQPVYFLDEIVGDRGRAKYCGGHGLRLPRGLSLDKRREEVLFLGAPACLKKKKKRGVGYYVCMYVSLDTRREEVLFLGAPACLKKKKRDVGYHVCMYVSLDKRREEVLFLGAPACL